ncbi:MAG: DUF6036 family nucleotidyltransferase [Candidatus Acidiferrales bacterium]|jgi:hypothetical protein
MSPSLPSPWAEFLDDLDALLDEPFELHCIGGFAVVIAYGLPRSTNDLDYRTLVPNNRVSDLQKLAGPGSALDRKHKIHLQYTAVGSIPEDYEERLKDPFAGRFKNIRVLIPDPYDLVLSKLSRNVERDREDVEYLAETCHLDAKILRERYEKELRTILIGPPELHDKTLNFWIEAYFSNA